MDVEGVAMRLISDRTNVRRFAACAAIALGLTACNADSNARQISVDAPGFAGTGTATGVAGIGGAAGLGAQPGAVGMPTGTSGMPGTTVSGTAGMMAGAAGMGRGSGGMTAGTGGAAGMMRGTGGMMVAGAGGMRAMAGAGGMMAGAGGSGGSSMMGGPCGSGTPTDGRPTTGALACIVEQHNAVRAMVQTTTPLPPLTWSADLAKYAQQWTDQTCSSPMHRTNPSLNGQRLGENLYASFGGGTDAMAGKQAIDGWAAEVQCYTYGAFMNGDKCDMTCTSRMNSDGCGHYTQVVWRASTQIGCGVTMCGSGFNMQTEVICNYGPAGNYVGMLPY
jgi:hypothetical protein